MQTRTIREQMEAIRQEAEALGAQVTDFGYGRKHPFAVVAYNGTWRKITICGSPRSGRDHASDRQRQNVRRAVKDMGG